jgi:hypothetical protein
MRATIKYLVDHPDVPCMIENIFVPHGYGNTVQFIGKNFLEKIKTDNG